MTRDRIRLCHVGCGYWGPNLLRNSANHAAVEIAAICDTRPDSLKRFGQRYKSASLYDALEPALADPTIDAVVLATPTGLHFQHVSMALAAGKHVFVEKPLAESVDQAIELRDKAVAAGVVLMVGHTFLYNNLVHAVKEYITEGALGSLCYAYSQRLNLGRFRRDSDVMWTLAPHDISILNFWFDDVPKFVSARGDAFIHKESDIAEVCFARLDYGNGLSAYLHLSWLDPQKRREMVLVGAERMLVYDDMNSDAHIRLYDKSAAAHHQSETADFADFTTRTRAGDLVIPTLQLVEPLAVEIDHFVECILTGQRPRSDGRQSIEVIAVLEALGRSMANNGENVEVLYPALAPDRDAGGSRKQEGVRS